MSKKSKFVTLEGHFQEIEDYNSTFKKVKIKVFAFDLNANNSDITRTAFENAKSSIFNIPIIAKYNEEKDDLEGHNVYLTKDKNDNYIIKMDTSPFGVVSNLANISFEDINEGSEENPSIKTYVIIDNVFLWKRYEATQRIEEWLAQGIEPKISMEIGSVEGKFESGVFEISSFEFEAITALGSDVEPCFPMAQIEEYSKATFQEAYFEMVKELKFSLQNQSSNNLDVDDINNNKEGGINILNEKFELIKKYENLTEEDVLDLKTNQEQYSLEDFDMKLKELSEAKNVPITTEFALTSEQLSDEVRKVLRTKKVISEDWWGDEYSENEFYYRDIKDNLVIVIDNAWENYYGIPYTTNGDAIAIDFENKIPYMYDWRPRTNDEVVNNFAKQEFEEKLKVFTDKAVEKAKTETTVEYESKISEFNSKIEELSLQNSQTTISEEFETLKSKVTEYETNISTLTDQFNSAKLENETLTESNQSLLEFKSNTETAQQEAFESQQAQLKTELVENFSKVLTAEEVQLVQDKDISIDEMEKEFKLIYADKDLQAKFSKKSKKTETEIPLNSFTCKKKDDWTSCIKK